MASVSHSTVLNYLKILLLCFSCLFPAYVKGSNCTHYYLSQPVRGFTCNPYHTRNPVMRLECNAYSEEEFKNFDVFWFYSFEGVTRQLTSDQDGVLAELQDPDLEDDPNHLFKESRLRISDLERSNNGSYWCQIGIPLEVNQTVTITYLEPSQTTLLLPEENYIGLPPCANGAYQDESIVRCATDPPPPNPVLTSGNCTQDMVPSQGASNCTQTVTLTPESGNCTQVVPSSAFPSWIYGLIAALAVFIGITLLLVIILICVRRNNGLQSGTHLKGSHPSLVKVQQSSDQKLQPPATHVILQVSSESSHVSTPPSADYTGQTLHSRSPPTDQDCDNVIYAEADMPYTSLSQDTMDDPTIYTPPTGAYTKLNLQSIDNPHLYSSAGANTPI